MTSDVLILGGGAIGLSLAYELAGRGLNCEVIDRGPLAREASWAGAGMIPEAALAPGVSPLEQLAALSCRLHAEWAKRLQAATGLDTGYRRSGALYLARDPQSAAELEQLKLHWQAQQTPFESLSHDQVSRLEPLLTESQEACLVPSEAQIRNPRHLKALIAACEQLGVRLSPGVEARRIVARAGQVSAVETSAGPRTAEQLFICGGAWSAGLVEPLGVECRIRPIRGQMVLLDRGELSLNRLINVGPRYLVPRDDGRLLVGSTEEDVGFEKHNTLAAIAGLIEFAVALAPGLAAARYEQAWAGLRPATFDGLPYLGRLPGYDNAWLAAGHFRAGLSLSCATAVVLADALQGKSPAVDLAPFRLDR